MELKWTSKALSDLVRLFEFEACEIRRILVGNYEVRYEIQKSTIYVLRLWHTRERR